MKTLSNYNLLNRREFISLCSKALLATGCLSVAGVTEPFIKETKLYAQSDTLNEYIRIAPTARYWIKHPTRTGFIKCLLCAQECAIAPNSRGRCRTRINIQGELKSLVYGRPISIHVDPIEKKPFYNFLPQASAFSLATAGCPLSCKFCQNWQISQSAPEDNPVPQTMPAQIVNSAMRANAPVIAYTYNEATVFTEYMTDIARYGKTKGLRSVLISCGYMQREPLREMCATLDAIKIDLKGFSEEFYRDICGARLQPVLENIKFIARQKKHLEIVNLVVPTLNDSDKSLSDMIDWILKEVGPDVPLHFSRFHPDYRMPNLPPTPISTLEKARNLAMERGMNFVYIGNVPNHAGNSTYCPSCKKNIIKRQGFFVEKIAMKNGACAYCGEKIAGVWA